MGQMQTLSIRVNEDDYQWLLSSGDPVAKTPSEKLRSLITRMRRQEEGSGDYDACADWMRALAKPLADSVSAHERKARAHSEAVAAALEWVPQLMALLVAERIDPGQPRSAAEIEAILLQRSFRLLSTLLRMGVTSYPATYDPRAVDAYLPEILEIAAIISTRQKEEMNHG